MKALRFQALATGLLFLLPGLARAAAPPAGTPAAAVTVTSLNDSGPGSLRQAIADAPAGSAISFSVTGTITLTSGALTIARNLDIEGPGPDKLTVSGNQASRVFSIQSGTVTLAGMTIANGLADGSAPSLPSVGGGVLNTSSGRLTLSSDVLAANRALGDASKSLAPGWPGAAAGGGVANRNGTLQVTACQFTGNLARGADGSRGSREPAGVAYGGAIYNGGALTVSGSTFSDNQAIGGNGCVSPMASGNAWAGAVNSDNAALAINGSRFSHNQAIGGSGNQITSLQPRAFGPNRGDGGAIEVDGGTGTITGCTLEHNQAIGGAGGTGADGGGAGSGGIQVTVPVTVSNCAIHDNLTLGGEGGPGGNGGEGWGGGLFSAFGGALTLSDSTVQHNLAMGGQGGSGGDGGNGLGGGLYEGAASSLILAGATVSDNLAMGGSAGAGGSAGQGVGGGVYDLGTFRFDATTAVMMNHASTGSDNVGP